MAMGCDNFMSSSFMGKEGGRREEWVCSTHGGRAGGDEESGLLQEQLSGGEVWHLRLPALSCVKGEACGRCEERVR